MFLNFSWFLVHFPTPQWNHFSLSLIGDKTLHFIETKSARGWFVCAANFL